MTQCDLSSTNEKFQLAIVGEIIPEKSRWIIVAFQRNKSGDQVHSPSIFDYCNLTSMFVMLNGRKYPQLEYVTNFAQQKFSGFYGDAAAFKENFYGVEDLVSSPIMNSPDDKELFPMFVFDMSKQSEKLKNSTTDIHIKAQFSSNALEDTEAFAVVISDKSLILQSDGNKMSVKY